MDFIYQKTLAKNIEFKGIGLHSGKECKVSILPAIENYGIVFKRTDIKKNNLIEANYANVSSAVLCTKLKNNFDVTVSTVEHLLASLYLMGIDNALIELNSEEVPIMDGSAKNFVDLIINSGTETQTAKRKYLYVTEKVEHIVNNKFISIEPMENNFEVNFKLIYQNSVIGIQENKLKIFQNSNLELKDIINARTFCLLEDVEKIKKAGLARGGSLENAIVVDKDKILNDGGLRNKKEFVNHKILDCIGDLYTSGYRIVGSVKCSQGGHYLTNQLLRKVFQNKENFSILEIKEKNLPHSLINRNLLKSIA